VQKYKIPVRADSNPEEFACAVARHFESSLVVDEDSTLHRFVNVIRKVNPSVASAAIETPSMRASRAATSASAGGMAGGGHGEDAYEPRLGSKRSRMGYDALDDGMEDGHRPQGQAPDQQMVACDNTNCPKEWFTLASVGLTPETIPDGKWYCPDCRLDPHDYTRPRGVPRSESRCLEDRATNDWSPPPNQSHCSHPFDNLKCSPATPSQALRKGPGGGTGRDSVASLLNASVPVEPKIFSYHVGAESIHSVSQFMPRIHPASKLLLPNDPSRMIDRSDRIDQSDVSKCN